MSDLDWFGLGEFFAGLTSGYFGLRTARTVQKKLVALVFWQGSIRACVAHIAEGNGTPADLDKLNHLLKRTHDETHKANTWLIKHRERIAKALGADIAQKLDLVVYQKMGPGRVRAQLEALVAQKSLVPDQARNIVREIDAFNNLLKQVRHH